MSAKLNKLLKYFEKLVQPFKHMKYLHGYRCNLLFKYVDFVLRDDKSLVLFLLFEKRIL